MTAPYLSNSWKPELITNLLNELVPEKCRVIIVSQVFDEEANEIEPHYKTKFKTIDIEPETIKVNKTAKVCVRCYILSL